MNLPINFIHIPKNAGTSIKGICDDNKIIYNSHNVNIFDSNIKNHLVIIRDPVLRFQSSVNYAFKFYTDSSPTLQILKKNNITTANSWVTVLRNSNNIFYKNIMDEMLNDGTQYIRDGTEKAIYKWTYCPQSLWINNPKYVILMENINEEIQLLSNKINKNLILPHYNQSTDVRTIEYMSPDNLNWLKYKFYKEDHKLYDNYKHMNVSKRLNL